ncbi:MAG: hypothetical protein AAF654_08420 [Myxococcota bacterium]
MNTELPRPLLTTMRRTARAKRALLPASVNASDIQWLTGVYDEVMTFGGPQFSEGVGSVDSVADGVSSDTVVWLDASPKLVEEIVACGGQPLAIGHAERFLAPPAAPARLEHWPTLTDVLDAARFGDPARYLAVHRDVLFSVPGTQAIGLATAIRDDLARGREDPWGRARRARNSLGDLGRGALRLAIRSLRRR